MAKPGLIKRIVHPIDRNLLNATLKSGLLPIEMKKYSNTSAYAEEGKDVLKDARVSRLLSTFALVWWKWKKVELFDFLFQLIVSKYGVTKVETNK